MMEWELPQDALEDALKTQEFWTENAIARSQLVRVNVDCLALGGREGGGGGG